MTLTQIQPTEDKQLVATLSAVGFGAKMILDEEESEIWYGLQSSLQVRMRDMATKDSYIESRTSGATE